MDKYFKDEWLERLENRVKDMKMGDLLRLQRTADGLCLTDFANITGIDRSTVCKIENGRRKKMSPVTYQTIISYLGGGFEDEIKALKQDK